jgi:acyl-coenzyme A thioesterase PaaI-like protein
MKLEDNRQCFVCGPENRYGLHLEFAIDNNNIMQTEFVPLEQHQGFKDIVHGGIIGLILDEIMVNLAWKLGKTAVSAELNIRLKRAAKVGESLIFRGWIDKEDKKIIYTKAEAKDKNGVIIAIAGAKSIKVSHFNNGGEK